MHDYKFSVRVRVYALCLDHLPSFNTMCLINYQSFQPLTVCILQYFPPLSVAKDHLRTEKKTSWYLPSTTLLSCALQPPDTHTLETNLVVHVATYNYNDTHQPAKIIE